MRQVGDGTKAANESAVSPILNFTMVSPVGNSSDYPFRYGVTADLGQTVYSYSTVHGLMVSSLGFCSATRLAVPHVLLSLQMQTCCSPMFTAVAADLAHVWPCLCTHQFGAIHAVMSFLVTGRRAAVWGYSCSSVLNDMIEPA